MCAPRRIFCILRVDAERTQDPLNDVRHVAGREPRFARRAHGLNDNADDEIETDLLRKAGQTILALAAPQVCGQSLSGDARDCRKGPQAMSDERSPGRIALSLTDEGRAASGDSLDRVDNGGPVCTSDFVGNLRQFRGDSVPQILQATEVGIEGAFRRPRLSGLRR